MPSYLQLIEFTNLMGTFAILVCFLVAFLKEILFVYCGSYWQVCLSSATAKFLQHANTIAKARLL